MKSNPSVLVLGLGASAALAANFSNSCDAASIKVSGNILTATCSTIFGQPKCSKLDLDKCIKNEGGTLRADPSGTGYVGWAINITFSTTYVTSLMLVLVEKIWVRLTENTALGHILVTNASNVLMTS